MREILKDIIIIVNYKDVRREGEREREKEEGSVAMFVR